MSFPRATNRRKFLKAGSTGRNSCYIGDCLWAIWLKTDFILGFLGKEEKTAQHRYRVFIEDRIGGEVKSQVSEVKAFIILGRSSFVEEVRAK